MFDYTTTGDAQPTHYVAHFTPDSGDFLLNGDARFTLDGSYYGQLSWKGSASNSMM
jgi:hypothetical protein